MVWFDTMILAARKGQDDERGWVQLLVLLIIGVMYGLGSLVKAKGKKVELEEEESADQPKGKPRYKPAEQWSGRSRPPTMPAGPSEVTQPRIGPYAQVPPQAPRPSEQLPVQPERPGRRLARAQPAQRPAGVRQKGILPGKIKPDLIPSLTEPDLGMVRPKVSLPKLGRIEKLKTRLTPLSEQEQPQDEVIAEAVVTPLLGYEEPDPLRAAILYYEILGKPLALRDRRSGIF